MSTPRGWYRNDPDSDSDVIARFETDDGKAVALRRDNWPEHIAVQVKCGSDTRQHSRHPETIDAIHAAEGWMYDQSKSRLIRRIKRWIAWA